VKDYRHISAVFLAVTLGLTSVCLTMSLLTPAQQAQARGGGGGGGRGGGGGGGERGAGFGGMNEGGWGSHAMGGYPGDRGAGFGGMNEGGWGSHAMGEERGGIGGGYIGDRGPEASAFQGGERNVSESSLRSAADHEYSGAGQRGLSTDGGFGRISSADTGSYGGHQNGATRPLASAAMADHGADVRSAWDNGNRPLFDRAWWGNHDGWWGYGGWGDGWWGGAGWGDLSGWWGMPYDTDPVEYDYGNNITYQGDQVYYGTQPTASVVEYYQQAQTLANSAPVIPTAVVNGLTQVTGDWKPLGVFSLTMPGDANSNTIFQLAVNKAGIVSGNYYNTLNNQSSPIRGKLDKKSMRVAFTVGKNKDVVYDTGLGNLLAPQSPILVHLNKSKTQQEVLVKLDKPKATGA
jgi:hypothetical protein